MLTGLGILGNAVEDRTDGIQAEIKDVSTTVSTSSITRKLQNEKSPKREHEMYTRAWAIYSRARTRRLAGARSII
jgi:hypothetical protein